MKIKIRKATGKDYDKVAPMVSALLDYQIKIAKDKDVARWLQKRNNFNKRWRKFISSNSKSKTGMLLIAEADGRIVGYSYNMVRDKGELFGVAVGIISHLYIAPKYRRAGISTMLRDEAYKWFRNRRAEYVCIFLTQGNTEAYKIYNKWGFKKYAFEMRKRL